MHGVELRIQLPEGYHVEKDRGVEILVSKGVPMAVKCHLPGAKPMTVLHDRDELLHCKRRITAAAADLCYPRFVWWYCCRLCRSARYYVEVPV